MVVSESGVLSCGPGYRRTEGSRVGQFLSQSAVESFECAVSLGTAGAGDAMLHTCPESSGGYLGRAACPVIGITADTVTPPLSEERACPCPETDRELFPYVVRISEQLPWPLRQYPLVFHIAERPGVRYLPPSGLDIRVHASAP